MEVKIGDKVRGQHWNNGYFVTVLYNCEYKGGILQNVKQEDKA